MSVIVYITITELPALQYTFGFTQFIELSELNYKFYPLNCWFSQL